MLNFNSAVQETMYDVVIEGHKWSFNEETTQKIIDLLNSLQNNGGSFKVASPAPAVSPVKDESLKYEDDKQYKPTVIEGEKLWQEDFLTISKVEGEKQYRLYITCPIGGDKGRSIRFAIKSSAKEAGAKFAGDYKAGKIYWAFKTRKEAQAFVDSRKAYNDSNKK